MQNTFWRIGTLVPNPVTGVSTDKDSLPLLFWNNLVAEPWLDYNADISGLQGTAVAEALRGFSNLTPSLGRAQRAEGSRTWAEPRAGFRVGNLVGEAGQRLNAVRP